jgi:hypothetical protein
MNYIQVLVLFMIACNVSTHGQDHLSGHNSLYGQNTVGIPIIPKTYHDQTVEELVNARDKLESKLLLDYQKLEAAQFDRTVNNSKEIHQVICKLIDINSKHATDLCIKNIDNPHSFNYFIIHKGGEPSHYLREHLFNNVSGSMYGMIRYLEQTKMDSEKHDTYIYYAARFVAIICHYDKKRIEHYKYVLLDDFKQSLVDEIIHKASEIKHGGR